MYRTVRISEFLHRKRVHQPIEPSVEYALVTVKLHHKGVILREKKLGSLIKSTMSRISKGDFILSGIDARNGAFGIVPNELDGAVVTNDFWYFEIDEKIIKRDFFYWLTSTPLFLDACIKSSRGETQRIRLQKDLFFNFELELPAIEEQEIFLERAQIVDELGSNLLSELDLQSTYLTQLRQTILQEAIEGKLTAEWRAHHPIQPGNPEFEAAALLSQIKAEKQRLNRKEKPLPPIREEEMPFELPEGWVWCRLGEIIKESPKNGYSPKPSSSETGTKSLKLGATTTGRFVPSEIKYIDEIIPEDSHYWLEPGDILIQRSNSLDHVGVSAIFNGTSYEFIYPDLMMKIMPVCEIKSPFMHKVLSSPFVRQYYRDNAKGVQKSMPKINQGIVNNTLFSLPPLAEQRTIVERVDRLLAMVDALAAQVTERKSQAEALMQAVLREAFTG